MIYFDLCELVYNNSIQLRYKRVKDGVVENLRTITDSRKDMTNMPDVVCRIAEAFPYTEFSNPDGPCEYPDFIRVMGSFPGIIRYNMIKYVYEDSKKITVRSKQRAQILDCLQDRSSLHPKLQKFCDIVFTEEVKKNFIAALPRIDVPVWDKDGSPKMISYTETSAPIKVTGFVGDTLKDLVVKEQSSQQIQKQETQKAIQYKDKFYPLNWDGTL